jgi:hypothetical protein
MATPDDILNTIKEAVDRLGAMATAKQNPLFKEVLLLLKKLDVKGDTITTNIRNLNLINELKSKIERIVIDPRYKKELKTFVQAYDQVGILQNQYFASFNTNFKPNPVMNALKKNAVNTTLNNLTQAGLQAGVTDGLRKILVTNVNAGGSYADMQEQLRNYLTTTNTGEGALERYVKTYANTAINQFSAEYSRTIAQDLGLEWYQYTGSLITTSRDFCIHSIDKRYMHESEFPTLLQGNIDGTQIHVNKKTGLPDGMMEGTTPENFPRRRGGWSCRHQLVPVDELLVPKNIKEKVYSSKEYQAWALRKGVPQKTA